MQQTRNSPSRAGSLLRTIDLPVSLHSVVTDPWEHSLFLGAGDGRIFEASLIGRTPLPSPGQPPAEAALGEAGIRTLAGHTRTVNCLATTSEHLVSGSDDGSVRIWDLQSLQVLRVIAAKGPITSILVQDRPPHMLASRGAEPGENHYNVLKQVSVQQMLTCLFWLQGGRAPNGCNRCRCLPSTVSCLPPGRVQ